MMDGAGGVMRKHALKKPDVVDRNHVRSRLREEGSDDTPGYFDGNEKFRSLSFSDLFDPDDTANLVESDNNTLFNRARSIELKERKPRQIPVCGRRDIKNDFQLFSPLQKEKITVLPDHLQSLMAALTASSNRY
jgi:hypothetical protein